MFSFRSLFLSSFQFPFQDLFSELLVSFFYPQYHLRTYIICMMVASQPLNDFGLNIALA